MQFQYLSIEKNNGVGVVKISNPATLNALNSKILSELNQMADIISSDEEISVVIITGEGRGFVAGADISEMANLNSKEGEAFSKYGSDVFRKIELMEKPTIAAVNSFALGGGCELAMACDIRIASEAAKFGQPEVGLGIIPGFSGTVRMTRIIGVSKAKELIFTGKVIDAQQALSCGLVNQVVPAEELMSVAMEMAATISSKALIAVKYAKQSIAYSLDNNMEDAIAFEQNLFGQCFATSDQKEGMEAFLNKRKPIFKNKI